MATCSDRGERKGCGAEIEWVEVLKSGKVMPIDVGPRPDGNIRKLATTNASTGNRQVEYVKKGPGVEFPTLAGAVSGDPTVELYVSHFATCPHASEHRK